LFITHRGLWAVITSQPGACWPSLCCLPWGKHRLVCMILLSSIWRREGPDNPSKGIREIAYDEGENGTLVQIIGINVQHHHSSNVVNLVRKSNLLPYFGITDLNQCC
jgi:hypothetical protein